MLTKNYKLEGYADLKKITEILSDLKECLELAGKVERMDMNHTIVIHKLSLSYDGNLYNAEFDYGIKSKHSNNEEGQINTFNETT